MKKRGFTLIELMVVVVIIGILAAIAIPNFVKIVDRAKEASVKANQHTVQVSVESLSIDNLGRYPGADNAADIRGDLPPNFANPYTGVTEEGTAGAALVADGNLCTNPGETSYQAWTLATGGAAAGDYNGTFYSIRGFAKDDYTNLLLMPGKD
jgi:prepilin-type N-terminal cleavage/methylation domain-containing protein